MVVEIFSKINPEAVLLCFQILQIYRYNLLDLRIFPFFGEKDLKKKYFQVGLFRDHEMLQHFYGINFKIKYLEERDSYDLISLEKFLETSTFQIFLKKRKENEERNFSNLNYARNSTPNKGQKNIENGRILNSLLKPFCDNKFLWVLFIKFTKDFHKCKISRKSYNKKLMVFQNWTKKQPSLSGSFFLFEDNDRNRKSIIFNKLEPFFVFFRHWTILESLLFTSSTMINFGLWKRNYKKNLLPVLISLGISFKDSKKNWVFLEKETKKNFLALIFKECRKQKIKDFFNPVAILFFFKTKNQETNWKVSSLDLVICLKFLLDFDLIGNSKGHLRFKFLKSLELLNDRKLLFSEIESTKKKIRISLNVVNLIVSKNIYDLKSRIVVATIRYCKELSFLVLKDIMINGINLFKEKGLKFACFKVKIKFGQKFLCSLAFSEKIHKRKHKDLITGFHSNFCKPLVEQGNFFIYVIDNLE